MNAAKQRRLELRVSVSALWLLICIPLSLAATDWPHFRGPNGDGISTDRLNRQWTGAATNPVWRVPLTNCLGSLTVNGGRVFTLARGLTNGVDKELCVALNATNGAKLWATIVDKASYPSGGVGFDDGPRSTPTVDGDSVFVLTTYLNLLRLNVTNGAVIWQQDMLDSFGGTVIPWENAASPVIENGLIYLNANCVTSTLVALRITDGSLAWRSQNDPMTHSTPTLATIHGVRQIIFATQNGLVSLDPLTGVLLWRRAYPFSYATSISVSPVVHQDMVFLCGAAAYNMGSFALRVNLVETNWATTFLWSKPGFASPLSSHWMTPVARDGFLYGQFGVQAFDGPNAQLKCIEMRTGIERWSVNGFGRCMTLLVDDHLVSLTERGQLVLVQPNTNTYTELGRFTAIPNYHTDTNKCWNAPAVADGRIFVRSTAYVASFDLSVPPLAVSTPQFSGSNAFDLAIRTINGAPINSNRLTNIEVRATANLSLALTQWNRLTNSLVLTGGVVRMPNVGTGTETQRFFIVSEPK